MQSAPVKWLVNAALVITSIIFTILFVDLLFNMAMPGIVSQKIFPRPLIRELGPHYQTFYPSVNDGTLKNWTAVLGDSYAVGFGDAYNNNEKDYSIFHHIHKQNGENFYIFARGGFGSIHSVREYFLTSREIDRAVFYPKREEPKKIVFLFYEGNDLNNNLDHYRASDGAGYASIDRFVTHEIEKPASSSRWSEFYLPIPDLLDAGSLKVALGIAENNPKDNEKKNDKGKGKNVILFDGGKTMSYPRVANGAAPELSDQDMQISLDIFFASMRYLKEKTGSIPVTVVYIPSVVTVYHWQNPVQVRTYETDQNLFVKYEDNLERSRYIRKRLADFSSQLGIHFIDATDTVSAAARTNYLHGVGDEGHFNSAGYQLVSKLIMSQGN